MADNCESFATLKAPVTVNAKDPDGDPVRGLRHWMAPAALAVIAPQIAIPNGKAEDLLGLCKTAVRNQLPGFCKRVVVTWETDGIPHGPRSV